MKRFIAYFDYLGFADFIMRNETQYQIRIIGNNFRDIENALAKGTIVRQPDGGVIANLDNSKLRCINFSDTVLIYSNDDSLESLKEILDVTLWYSSRCNLMLFPVRGCVYYGEFIDFNYNRPNPNNGAYHVNSVFGKALVNAHYKAEDQAWAGTVIDNTICEFLRENHINENEYLTQFAKPYKVPYKKHPVDGNEWVIHLVETKGAKLNAEAHTNYKASIIDNFGKHNKRTEGEKVQAMLSRTLQFLESYT